MRSCLGNSPLHIAAFRGDTEAIRALVEAGIDVNIRGDVGFTPLHDAVESRSWQAVALLLELGANPNLPDDAGLKPMDWWAEAAPAACPQPSAAS